MSTRFRVRDSFEITGRGLVIAGDVIDGAVHAGMQLLIPGRGPLLVASVEFVDWSVGGGSDASVGLIVDDALPLNDLRAVCPPGTELLVRARDDAASGGRGPLRRFWFQLDRGLGVGVTAPTEAEARALAEATRARYHATAAFVGVIPDVDVSTLDPGHVLPNMGPAAERGVWYPLLNV